MVWIPPWGVGQSAGMKHILWLLVEHLGEEGWPPVVALRVEHHLIKSSFNPAHKPVHVTLQPMCACW